MPIAINQRVTARKADVVTTCSRVLPGRFAVPNRGVDAICRIGDKNITTGRARNRLKVEDAAFLDCIDSVHGAGLQVSSPYGTVSFNIHERILTVVRDPHVARFCPNVNARSNRTGFGINRNDRVGVGASCAGHRSPDIAGYGVECDVVDRQLND